MSAVSEEVAEERQNGKRRGACGTILHVTVFTLKST